jgi:uncharacterized membrane protein
MAKVLLAGESWSTTSVHTKGFDSFVTSTYAEGADAFIAALEVGGHTVEFQPNHVAAERFPFTAAALNEYDVVVLSDIGANTLLLPHDVFVGGSTRPNRLMVLADWVRAGGRLLMVGGYLSFTGIEAKANYRSTPLAAVLPVDLEIADDRQETPHGATAAVTEEGRAHLPTLEQPWPPILGFQRFTAKAGTQTLAVVDGHPLVVVGGVGAGRSAAVATDMGPHWLSSEFMSWAGFNDLWNGVLDALLEVTR